eukprot:CAMPEP_0115250062 /NCGR_PEP_ID=MMETSP0270-20121206/42913_1 /TAXON_ID=71861 /ORGANISM="Scrippsiella trochoidea, Strain CCMP3099" /LENGTH=65 /DNA_ID=CAMNT_0002665425 /DNA_START=20 /DNA_END=217 /DNA_ORIENTATION=+
MSMTETTSSKLAVRIGVSAYSVPSNSRSRISATFAIERPAKAKVKSSFRFLSAFLFKYSIIKYPV